MTHEKKLASKLGLLKDILQKMESVIVAFSGGVDSTFLLKAAKTTLGDNVIAVTSTSLIHPGCELKAAKKNARLLNARHIVITANELKNKNFINNTPERCYYCKKNLFSRMKELAKEHKIRYIVDGSTFDDTKDYRPGMKAARELKIKSPLKDAGFKKDEIRILSKKMKLSSWDKPSSPCLATRFPYGDRLTQEGLKKVEAAEKFILSLGVKQTRVRVHGQIIRIEVDRKDFPVLLKKNISEKIVNKFKTLGYIYITLDLQGFRTGSMNEAIAWKRK